MGRLPRMYVEGAVYCVTCIADTGRDLFPDVDDAQAYRTLLYKYRAEFNFNLLGFSFDNGCIDLLIEPSASVTISQIMHAITSNYTKYYNNRYGQKGHLFRGRFKAVLIEKGDHVMQAVAYIRRRMSASRLGADAGAIECADTAAAIVTPDSVRDFEDMLKKQPCIGSPEFLARAAREATREDDAASPVSGPATPRQYVFASVAAVAVLVLGISVFMSGARARDDARAFLAQQKAAVQAELQQQTVFIKRDMEEKYRADQVSYQAMARRLEIEKERSNALQQKAKE